MLRLTVLSTGQALHWANFSSDAVNSTYMHMHSLCEISSQHFSCKHTTQYRGRERYFWEAGWIFLDQLGVGLSGQAWSEFNSSALLVQPSGWYLAQSSSNSDTCTIWFSDGQFKANTTWSLICLIRFIQHYSFLQSPLKVQRTEIIFIHRRVPNTHPNTSLVFNQSISVRVIPHHPLHQSWPTTIMTPDHFSTPSLLHLLSGLDQLHNWQFLKPFYDDLVLALARWKNACNQNQKYKSCG